MPIRSLPPHLQVKAENELNEVSSKVQDDLKQIREWALDQPHLNIRSDDQWLLSFLRGCKFNHKRTTQKLDSFYTARSRISDFFADRNPFSPEIQEILKLGLILPLPRTSDPSAPRLLLLRPAVKHLNKSHTMNVMKVTMMILDILINEEDDFIICGVDTVVDLRNVSVAQMLQMTPGNCKKIFWCFQDAYPIRPQAVNLINLPSFFEHVFSAVKLFISEKLKRRIHVFSDHHLDKMYDYIPRSAFPEEYGGEAGSLDELTSVWKLKVESYHDWFLEDLKYCSDEAKRCKDPKKSVWSWWSSYFEN